MTSVRLIGNVIHCTWLDLMYKWPAKTLSRSMKKYIYFLCTQMPAIQFAFFFSPSSFAVFNACAWRYGCTFGIKCGTHVYRWRSDVNDLCWYKNITTHVFQSDICAYGCTIASLLSFIRLDFYHIPLFAITFVVFLSFILECMANTDDDGMLQVHEALLFLHMPQVCASLFVCIDCCGGGDGNGMCSMPPSTNIKMTGRSRCERCECNHR